MLRPLALLALAAPLPAQVQSFGHRWAELEPVAIPSELAAASSLTIEVDFAAGDLDGDGDGDLVVARKEPFTKPGGRTNLLLLNEGGVLVDRTALHASASDVPGDQGFLTPTTDRDVALADVDLDGWLDVVTCPALMDDAPKAVSHPRVYRNLQGSGGAWQGLLYEEARIPQLVAASGLPVAPHATAVLAGDVTADGFPDLYLVDHDSGFVGYSEPAPLDLEDRLLVNGGSGYFADETALRMTPVMTVGGFGVGGLIGDYNQDGAADVMRCSTGNQSDPVTEISVAYNQPAAAGTFAIHQRVYEVSPYSVGSGDLNQDGRLDVVAGDDNADRYLLNTGVDPLGRVIWGPAKTFDFLYGSDDGFVGQVLVHDLDADGWQDVLIADVDVDVSGERRLHVYHNLGGLPGGEVVLREECEAPTVDPWYGVSGLRSADLKGTYDVAALDLDGDGFDDLVLGRRSGLFVWRNATGDQVCQPDLGFGGPGIAKLSLCGDALAPGGDADLVVAHARPNAPGVLAFGVAETAIPFAGGTLVPVPIGFATFTTDGAGKWVRPALKAAGPPGTIALQAVVIDPAQPHGFAITNALRAQILP